MSNLIPFEGGGLPAHLRNLQVPLNDDILAHATASTGKLAIKGKVFSIIKGGERKLVMNPKDPESPATYLELVLLRVNRNQSKVFYSSGYNSESSDGQKPDCASANGVAPDAGVAHPQASLCATCPQNVWGSKISESGKKVKACQDSVRVAVAPVDDLDNPLLLQVPPASIKPLAQFGEDLKKRGVNYNWVLTRLGFEAEEATPKLTFRPIGFLDAEAHAKVQELASGDQLDGVLGLNFAQSVAAPALPAPAEQAAAVIEKARETATAVATKDKKVTAEETAAAVAHAVKEAPKPAAPAPKVVEQQVDLGGVDFDDLSFD